MLAEATSVGNKVNFFVLYDGEEEDGPVPHVLESAKYQTTCESDYDSWLLLEPLAEPLAEPHSGLPDGTAPPTEAEGPEAMVRMGSHGWMGRSAPNGGLGLLEPLARRAARRTNLTAACP